MKPKNDILQGTLTLLVLRSVEARGPLHGYALCGHIQRVSASWNLTEKGRRAKYYAITPRGRAQLAAERESWERLTRGVGRVLRYS